MDKKQIRNILKTSVTILGMYGVVRIMQYITPPYLGPVGKAGCYTATILLTAACSDIFDQQVLKYERVIDGIANGDKVVVF